METLLWRCCRLAGGEMGRGFYSDLVLAFQSPWLLSFPAYAIISFGAIMPSINSSRFSPPGHYQITMGPPELGHSRDRASMRPLSFLLWASFLLSTTHYPTEKDSCPTLFYVPQAPTSFSLQTNGQINKAPLGC